MRWYCGVYIPIICISAYGQESFSWFALYSVMTTPDHNATMQNILQVVLNRPPWLERWERMELHGVLDNTRKLNEKQRRRAQLAEKPWEKYDLMLDYRKGVNEAEQESIMDEVYSRNQSKDKQARPVKSSES